MSPQIQLDLKLTAIARRFRLLTVERRVLWCLLPGLAIALGLLVAHKLERLDDPVPLMGAAVAASLLAGVLWGFLKRVSLLDAAMLADERLQLKERLSTALFVRNSATASALVPALLRDAAQHAERISPQQVLPHRAPRAMWGVTALAVLIGGAWLAPQIPLGITYGQLAVRQQMKDQGRELRKIAQQAKQDAQARGLKTPAELAAKLEKLAKELEQAKLSKKAALLKTGKLAEELRLAQQRQALLEGRSPLGPAAEALKNTALETREAQDAGRAVREQRADDLSSKLQRIAQELRAGKPTAQKDRDALARDLRELGKALEGSGLGGASSALQQGADRLQQGDMRGASQAVERAAQQAAQSAQAQAERQALKQMAEQLQQGQQQVAQADQKPGSG